MAAAPPTDSSVLGVPPAGVTITANNVADRETDVSRITMYSFQCTTNYVRVDDALSSTLFKVQYEIDRDFVSLGGDRKFDGVLDN